MHRSLGHAMFDDYNDAKFAWMDGTELTHSFFRELGAYACMCCDTKELMSPAMPYDDTVLLEVSVRSVHSRIRIVTTHVTTLASMKNCHQSVPKVRHQVGRTDWHFPGDFINFSI